MDVVFISGVELAFHHPPPSQDPAMFWDPDFLYLKFMISIVDYAK